MFPTLDTVPRDKSKISLSRKCEKNIIWKCGVVHLKTEINHFKHYLMVDTGAADNIISRSLVDSVGAHVVEMDSPQIATCANGSPIEFRYFTRLVVRVCDCMFDIKFYVGENDEDDLIIGRPGITGCQLLIDADREVIVCKRSKNFEIYLRDYMEEFKSLSDSGSQTDPFFDLDYEKELGRRVAIFTTAVHLGKGRLSEPANVRVKNSETNTLHPSSKENAIPEPERVDTFLFSEERQKMSRRFLSPNRKPVEQVKSLRIRNETKLLEFDPEEPSKYLQKIKEQKIETRFRAVINPNYFKKGRTRGTNSHPLTPELNILRLKNAHMRFKSAVQNSHYCKIFKTSEPPFHFEESCPSNLKEKISHLLEENRSSFCEDLSNLRPSKLPPVHIPLKPGAVPVKCPMFRTNLKADEILKEFKKPLDENGCTGRRNSPWRSNTFLVPKKLPEGIDPSKLTESELMAKQFRMVHDYRKVNEQVEDINYCLPRIDMVKEKVIHSKFFSKLDCRSGYFQLRLDEESIPITSVIIGGEQVCYNVLTFGIKCAPALFQASMEDLFHEEIFGNNSFMQIYIDDILIHSKSESEHLKHLELVFKKLRDVDLQLNREKCSFGGSSVRYLGHFIGNGKVYADPDRVKAIHDMPHPTDKTSLRSFIGTLNQFKDFIPNLREILRPLDKMTSQKKEVKFEWTEEAQEAFELGKKALTSDSFLVIFDPHKEHILECDASDYALSGILKQVEEEDGKRVERVVEYHSRAFNAPERRHTVSEKELNAIISSLRHWRSYLAFDTFIVRSDHHAICQASRIGLTSKTIPNHARLARWAWELQNFNCKIQYVKGKSHVVADCLSRNVFPKIELKELVEQEILLTGKNPMSFYSITQMCKFQPILRFMSETFRNKYEKLIEAQKSDVFCKSLIDQISSNPKSVKKLGKKIKSRFLLVNGVLCNQQRKTVRRGTMSDGPPELEEVRKELETIEEPTLRQRHIMEDIDKSNEFINITYTRIVVPEAYIWQVLSLVHQVPTAGHFGINSTIERAKLQFYWPKMRNDISDFVMSCDVCQRRQPKNTKDGHLQVQALELPEEQIEPFSYIYMDQCEIPSVKYKGYKYIIIAMDMTSKWMFARPVKTLSSNEVIKFVNEEILKMGKPSKIVTDNATYFSSAPFQQFCIARDIRLAHGVANYPLVAGLAEKNVGTVKTMISKFLTESLNWVDLLPELTIAYNTHAHCATGFSPFFLVFGRHYLIKNLDHQTEVPTFPPLEHMGETTNEFRARMQLIWKAAIDELKKINQKSADSANETRLDIKYRIGDKVLRRVTPDKLGPGLKKLLFDDGPYQIVRMLGPFSFEMVHLTTGQIVKSNASQCKRYHFRSELPRIQLLDQLNKSLEENEVFINTLKKNSKFLPQISRFRSVTTSDHKSSSPVNSTNINPMSMAKIIKRPIDETFVKKINKEQARRNFPLATPVCKIIKLRAKDRIAKDHVPFFVSTTRPSLASYLFFRKNGLISVN